MDFNTRHSLARLGEHLGELTAAFDEPGATIDVDTLTAIAARAVPHAQHCGLTVIETGQAPRTLAATGQAPRMVDLLQRRLGQGPCLDAAANNERSIADDLTTDHRWPSFGPACVDATEVRSMLSIRLWLADGNQAAMSFHATTPAAFQDMDVGIASMFAPFAASAVEQALLERDAENFEAALSDDRRIGIAIGILMARDVMTIDQASDLLRTVSLDLNRRLRDVADEIALTGEIPTKRHP